MSWQEEQRRLEDLLKQAGLEVLRWETTSDEQGRHVYGLGGWWAFQDPIREGVFRVKPQGIDASRQEFQNVVRILTEAGYTVEDLPEGQSGRIFVVGVPARE